MRNFLVFTLLMMTTAGFAEAGQTTEPQIKTNQEKISAIKNITRLAFGSCNNQNDPQPLWEDMMQTKPDLFIWGGDIIYADWEQNYDIKGSYDKQKAHPDYTKFRAQTPILGIWDDHDYEGDNGDGTNSKKVENQKFLLDFLDEPADSPRRKQEGIYTSYQFGEKGKRVKILLLDGRFFKNLEADAPILGKKQWDWLEQELKNSTANIHFIMTGLSVFSPLMLYSEEWWEHPKEAQRMLDLLKKYNVQAPVFLTGDKHFGSIFKGSGQLEMLASGMTHVVNPKTWWYISRKMGSTWFGLNYGLIDIEWENSIPTLFMRFRTVDHRDAVKRKYRWEDKEWKLQKLDPSA